MIMRLSIITINFNNLEGLKKTAESVINQTWKEFEWIIIDGCSTDGSKEYIVKLNDELTHNGRNPITYWCSEPDKGIYNAMNKGIKNANGEYFLFLSSGDSFVDKDIVADFYTTKYCEDIVAGDIIGDGAELLARQNPDEADLDYDYMVKSSIMHPSSFIRKKLFEKFGYYDENLKIVSDWKFFLYVLIKENCSYAHWHRFVTDFATDGISENELSHPIIWSERKAVLDDFLNRYHRSIEKRDKRIYEIDLPLFTIIKRRLINKINKFFSEPLCNL